MIQTILRFTCDECGQVTDCEVRRTTHGNEAFTDGMSHDNDLLRRCGLHPGKLVDRCGRCRRKLEEAAK